MKRLTCLAGTAALISLLSGLSCLEDRKTDITAGADLVVPFIAVGHLNTIDLSETVNFGSAADLQSIISENGLEPGSIRVRMESVSYRVTQKDATPGRTISGTILVARQGEAADSLVQLTGIQVNDDANKAWIPVPLTGHGAALIDSVLEDYLIRNVPANITVSVHGTSTPGDIETNFRWELLIKLSVTGKKKFTVFEPF